MKKQEGKPRFTHRRDDIDWEAVGREYRTGVKSDAAIAKEFGCSKAAVQKRAAREGWEKDLSARIRAKAETKVARAQVAKKGSHAITATEKQVIEVNAQVQADVIMAHRVDVLKVRNLVNHLVNELGFSTVQQEALAQFAEIAAEVQAGIRSADNGQQLSQLETRDQQNRFNKAYSTFISVIGLPSRAQTVQRLSDALKTLVGLERQAFGIDKDEDGGKDAITALKELHGVRV